MSHPNLPHNENSDDLSKILEQKEAEVLALRLEYDQHHNTLEQTVVSLKRDYQASQSNSSKLKLENETLKAQLEKKDKVIEAEQKRKQEADRQLREIKQKLDETSKDFEGLKEILEKRDRDLNVSAETIQQLESKLSQIRSEKDETSRKTGISEAELITLQFENSRLQQEKQAIEKQNKWFSEELERKTNELLELSREKTHRYLEFQTKIQALEEERDYLRLSYDTAKNTATKQTEQIKRYLESLKESEEKNAMLEEQFQLEKEKQNKLVDLYKQKEEESSKKASESQDTLKVLKNMFNLEKAQYEEALKKTEEKFNKLKESYDQLKNSEKDTQPSSLSPSTFAERPFALQQKYEAATRELLSLKNENRALNTYLQQILKELEEKAPILVEQRKDYENTVQKNMELTQKLESAMQALEDLQQENKVISKENDKLKTENNDLSRQVQTLLHENLSINGSSVVPDDATSGDLPSVIDANRVISDRLVTFKNIQDIQVRNRELLAMVRQLSSDQEARADDINDNSLEEALKQIEKLANVRNAQEKRLEEIVKQRDLFRALAEARNSNREEVPQFSSRFFESTAGERENYPDVIKDLKDQLESLRREKKTSEDMLKDDLQKAREELITLRNENAKSLSRIDYFNESTKNLYDTIESQKREIEFFRKRNGDFVATNMTYQQRLDDAIKTLSSAQEENKRLNNHISNIREELGMRKANEDRLVSEKGLLMEERNNLRSLLSKVETMQSGYESSEALLKKKLQMEIDSLTEKLKEQRSRSEEDIANLQSEKRTLKLQLEELTFKLQTKEAQLQDNKEQLIKTTAQATASLEANYQLKTSLASVEAKLMSFASERPEENRSAQSKQSDSLQLDLRIAQAEIQNLREELDQEREHLVIYKQIASGSEESLKSAQDEISKLKEELSRKEEHHNKMLEKLKSDLHQAEDLNMSLISDQNELQAELQRETQKVEEANQKVVASEKNLLEMEEQARKLQEEVLRVQKYQEDAHNNYERELILHAVDVEALSSMREKYFKAEAELKSLTKEKETAEIVQKENETAWVNQKQLYIKQLEEADAAAKELRNQNSILLNQMEALSKQSHSQSTAVEYALEASDAEQNVNELRELVAYLRREKEIIQTQFDLANQERARFKAQAERAQSLLEEARTKLREEQEKSLSSVQLREEQKTLMQQLDQLNLLKESNTLLREQQERALKEVKNLEEKNAILASQLQPIVEEKNMMKAKLEGSERQIVNLEAEIGRWKARVQKLVTKYKNSELIDTEEHRKVVENLATVTEQLEESKKQVEKLSKDAEDTNVKVEEATKKATDLETQLQEKDNDNKILEAKVRKLKQHAGHWNNEFKKLQKQVEDEKAAATSTEEKAKEESAKAHQEKLKSMEEEKQKLSNELKELQESNLRDKTNLRKTVAVLKEKNTEITNLKTQLEDEKRRIMEKELRLSMLETRIKHSTESAGSSTVAAPAEPITGERTSEKRTFEQAEAEGELDAEESNKKQKVSEPVEAPSSSSSSSSSSISTNPAVPSVAAIPVSTFVPTPSPGSQPPPARSLRFRGKPTSPVTPSPTPTASSSTPTPSTVSTPTPSIVTPTPPVSAPSSQRVALRPLGSRIAGRTPSATVTTSTSTSSTSTSSLPVATAVPSGTAPASGSPAILAAPVAHVPSSSTATSPLITTQTTISTPAPGTPLQITSSSPAPSISPVPTLPSASEPAEQLSVMSPALSEKPTEDESGQEELLEPQSPFQSNVPEIMEAGEEVSEPFAEKESADTVTVTITTVTTEVSETFSDPNLEMISMTPPATPPIFNTDLEGEVPTNEGADSSQSSSLPSAAASKRLARGKPRVKRPLEPSQADVSSTLESEPKRVHSTVEVEEVSSSGDTGVTYPVISSPEGVVSGEMSTVPQGDTSGVPQGDVSASATSDTSGSADAGEEDEATETDLIE